MSVLLCSTCTLNKVEVMQTFFFLSFLELAGMPPHGMMPPPGFPGMHAVPGMPPPPGQISDPQPPPPPPPGGQMMPPPQPMGGQFPPVPPHMPPPQVHKQYTYLLILLKVIDTNKTGIKQMVSHRPGAQEGFTLFLIFFFLAKLKKHMYI